MRSTSAHLVAWVVLGLLLVAGVAAIVLPAASQADVERTRGRLVDVAETAAALRSDGARCPSGRDLVAAQAYDAPPKDPWGREVQIVCDGERVVAVSVGPDGRRGTADDIRR
jgi:hypothetical protein